MQRKIGIIFLLLIGTLGASDSGQILFTMHRGDVGRAIELYRESVQRTGGHDYHLLKQMARVLLERGQHSESPEDQLMTLLGAGIAGEQELLPILRAGVYSSFPQVQLAAVSQLANFHSDEVDRLLGKALSSNFVPVRLEALHQLASKRHPTAADQLEALMVKLPPEARPLFPRLFTLAGHQHADSNLRRMLADADGALRRATIMSLADADRDDFLPLIRQLSYHTDALQQEVCCVALGRLRDSESIPRLAQLAKSREESVKLAALYGLYLIGKTDAREGIEQLAKSGNLYAITALADMPGSENALAGLFRHEDLAVRINAGISLLRLRDHRARLGLEELLIPDSRDLGLRPSFTPGGALLGIEVIPGAKGRAKLNPVIGELARGLRESILLEAMHLDEDDFLQICRAILEAKQNDLVPLVVRSLENMATPRVVALLQEQRTQAGAPLVRDYCNLALYRMGEEGPYETQLKRWLAQQRDTELIQLRPMLSKADKGRLDSPFALSPSERSRLLVESYEALAMHHDEEGVSELLRAIGEGNPHNAFALAGLLIKASE